MWQTFLQSEAWNKKPSEVLGIEEPYPAYCFDEACWAFGVGVRAKVDAAGKSTGKHDKDVARQARAENALREALGEAKRFRSVN